MADEMLCSPGNFMAVTYEDRNCRVYAIRQTKSPNRSTSFLIDHDNNFKWVNMTACKPVGHVNYDFVR